MSVVDQITLLLLLILLQSEHRNSLRFRALYHYSLCSLRLGDSDDGQRLANLEGHVFDNHTLCGREKEMRS